jgi:hypothetical protein
LDAEHDTVDGSSDEILPKTTDRKVGMGKEEGRHPPLEGEWTHLVGENFHALGLVLNPRVSGLIALHDLLLVISYVCCAILEPLLFAPYFS